MEEKEINEEEFKQIESEVSQLDKSQIEELQDKAESYIEEGIEYVDLPLDAKGIQEKYILLQKAEIDQAYNDLTMKEQSLQLEEDLPKRLLEDSIKEIEKDLENGVISKDRSNPVVKVPATDAEKTMLRIKLAIMKDELAQNLPTRSLRNQIAQNKFMLDSPDAPGKQIKKLRKAIRNRKETVLSSRAPVKSKGSYLG